MRVSPAGLEGVEHPHGEVGDHEEGDQLPPRLGLGLALAAREPELRGHSLPWPRTSGLHCGPPAGGVQDEDGLQRGLHQRQHRGQELSQVRLKLGDKIMFQHLLSIQQ